MPFLIRIAFLVTLMFHNVDVSVGVNDGDCGFSVDQGASLTYLVSNFQHLSMLSHCKKTVFSKCPSLLKIPFTNSELKTV